jgi:DNA-binding NarL/FixJ family response regulator
MMNPAQAWDAVLSIQHDVERIVSQAVRGGRVRQDDSQDAVNTAMVASVALAERYDGTIGTFAAYALASVRLSLWRDEEHRPDALDRIATAEIENAEISANSRRGGFKPARAIAEEIPQLGVLSPLQNRVARLLAAGKPIGQIAKQCGMTTHGVKIVAGQAAGRIKGEGKKAKL